MPNYVRNLITVRGEENEIDRMINTIKGTGEYGAVDFNSLIPMPETLNIVSGSVTKEALVLHLYEKSGGKLPSDSGLAKSCFNMFTEPSEELFEQAYQKAKKSFEETALSADLSYLFKGESPKSLEDARYLGQVIAQNIADYGCADWYDWRIHNWGTKWNACCSEIARTSDCECTINFDTAWSMPLPVIEVLVAQFPELSFDGYYSDEDFGSNNHGHWNGAGGICDEIPDEMSREDIYEICWGEWPDDTL